jgi:hypothetical protein
MSAAAYLAHKNSISHNTHITSNSISTTNIEISDIYWAFGSIIFFLMLCQIYVLIKKKTKKKK